MVIKMTSKRQVTFPKEVTERLCLKQGDVLQVSETADGILIKPHRFSLDKLAPLRGKIDPNLPAPDLETIRNASALDSSLRH